MAFKLLLIDDDPNDRDLTIAAIQRSSDALLVVKRSAREALDYIDELSSSPNDSPALVFLDLKLPDAGGLELLAELRRRASGRHIPVVVFTDSRNEANVAESYELGANAYVVKPVAAREFRSVVHATVSFWLNSNTRPRSTPRLAHRSR